MEKWLILGLGHGKYKKSLEHLVVPESKEVVKTQKDRGRLQGYRSHLKDLPLELEQSGQQNK